MSKKLQKWLSQIDDNAIDGIAGAIEIELWLENNSHEAEEERDNLQREIYNELIKIKEG